MAVVCSLAAGFSPLPPSSSPPSRVALICRVRNDVSRGMWMSEIRSAIMIASSSVMPRSVIYFAAAPSSFCSQATPVAVHAVGAGRGKIHHYTGRLLSSSSTVSHRQKSQNALGFGEWTNIWTQKGDRRWKVSPAKDSRRDVLTGPAEASDRNLNSTRTGEDKEEDGNGSRSGELADAKSVLSQQEKLLKTDSLAAREGVSPAAAKEKGDGGFGNTAAIGTIAAGLGLVIVLGGFGAVGYFYKDQLNEFLIQFSDFIEGYGPAGYGLFVLVYAGLEILAIPAIPLTMSAGLLFGAVVGTIIVSIAGTIAATGAFLIARYLARDRILAFAKGNKKFLAIDKAIGDDGFRVVTLLRLSPLLPFSLGNYLYGLTSVKLGPYVLGSWLGMLPGSWAYVSAGAISRSFIVQSENDAVFSGGPEQWWTLGLGLAATVFAATYVTRIAKEALKDVEE